MNCMSTALRSSDQYRMSEKARMCRFIFRAVSSNTVAVIDILVRETKWRQTHRALVR